MSDMRTNLIGREILGYEIVSFLAEGGMATVWLGEHRHLKKVVAIKVLDPVFAKEWQIVERFKKEAETLIKLYHPNIVWVENFSIDELAMVMEYVEGESLDKTLARRKYLPYKEAWGIFEQVLDAVEYAHDHAEQVIHRDLKPSNIMVRANGAAKVMDFGIARVKSASMKTQTGTSMGTAHYMSPEQVLGRKTIDHRTDIYSLGVTFFEVLTGVLPFKGKGEENTESDFLVKKAQVEERPPNPRDLKYPGDLPWTRDMKDEISVELADAILRALEKDPDKRFQAAKEMKKALQRAVNKCAEEGKVKKHFGDTPISDVRKTQDNDSKIKTCANVPTEPSEPDQESIPPGCIKSVLPKGGKHLRAAWILGKT